MAKAVLARDIMSRPVRQVTSGTSVKDAADFLLRHGISGAPVIDEHGRWVGVFTQNDLTRYMHERIRLHPPTPSLGSRGPTAELLVPSADRFGMTPVREFMTPGMYSVFPDSTLPDVARTMASFKIHRVFVIDARTGALEGVISALDVLTAMGTGGRERKRSRARRTQSA